MQLPFRSSAFLRQEIETWVADNIISREQATRLIDRYQLDAAPPWYMRSGFWVRGLAVLLAGLALFLIISENWHHLPIPMRMATGLLPLLAGYLLGWHFLRKDNRDAADLAFFFSNIVFGLNIFLQAQIFHISSYYPNGILWWIIGALPLALWFRSSLQHGLVQLLFFIWIIQQNSFNQFSVWGLLLFIGMAWLLMMMPNRLLFIAAIVNLYLLLINCDIAFKGEWEYALLPMIGVTGLLVASALPYLPDRYSGGFRASLLAAAVGALTGVLYFYSYSDVVDEVLLHHRSVFAVLSLAASAALLWPQRRQFEYKLLLGLSSVILLTNLAGMLPEFAAVPGKLKGGWGEPLAIVNNVLLFGMAIWLMVTGLDAQRKRLFMSGILLIALLAITRYLDLFGNYLATAGIFLLSAIFLYAVNQYWDKRYEK